MRDSHVAEKGTHRALIESEGEYCRLWTLQAKQFLP
jgi:ABC-type multidrug transport system fused ATPase/permease subunit